jgi:signal transduction histidine kinase
VNGQVTSSTSLRRRWRDWAQGPAGRSLLVAVGILALLLLAWWQAGRWYEALLLAETKAQAAVRASLRGSALSLAIGRRFALLQGLHAYVQAEASSNDFADRFQVFAADLYSAPSARGVRNITIAPDGVVRYVYPLAGNEAAIGYAPLNDPRPHIRQSVERAIATRQIILSGPLELVQGEVGLIARQAVYVRTSGGGEAFWGLVNIALDLPPLLDEAELDVQTDVTHDYALRDGTGQVFYGAAEIFDQDPVIYLIPLPEGKWELAGVPQGGWGAEIERPLRIFQVGGLIIAALAAGLSYLFARRQAELAQAYARQKAITEQNIRLHEQSQQLAVLEERQRIARELHDSVSQALYSIGLGARTARALLDRDPDKAAEPVEYILSLAEGGLAEMRALILELRPDSLEREGLVSVLSKQAAALRARHGLEVETALGEEPDLPLEAKEGLYRVAQEALNNTVKHAQASRVVIQLQQDSDEIVLSVQDDGIGFDPQGEYPGHVGLHTMRERVEKMGGVLHIESVQGQGARIRVTLALLQDQCHEQLLDI